jgi:hypothetical protein
MISFSLQHCTEIDPSSENYHIYYRQGELVCHTGYLYKKATNKELMFECRIIVEDRWTDKEGSIFFKALFLWDTPAFEQPNHSNYQIFHRHR